MSKVKIEKLDKQEQIAAEWQAFSQTLAFEKLMEYINVQKEAYCNLAGGPLEVGTISESGGVSFAFEPEKYAYLLQRGVGCDIVKMYIDDKVASVSK